jgi:hypothetical protein
MHQRENWLDGQAASSNTELQENYWKNGFAISQ